MHESRLKKIRPRQGPIGRMSRHMRAICDILIEKGPVSANDLQRVALAVLASNGFVNIVEGMATISPSFIPFFLNRWGMPRFRND